jgi:hypothetical protein
MSDRSDKGEPQDLRKLHDEAVVDIRQIDMMLALTPAERLEWLFVTASSLAHLVPDDDADFR